MYWIAIESGKILHSINEDKLGQIMDECEAKGIDYWWGNMYTMKESLNDYSNVSS